MADLTAENFAQRVIDFNLLQHYQVEQIWSELGTREVSLGEFQNILLRKELLTNYQVERIVKGLRTGYFYGDYKALYMIGTGTFARVFRTVHKDTGKVVAAKVLRRRFSEDPKRALQFMTEGELGKGLRHPNICPIYEVHSETSMYQQGTSYFLIIEFIEGQNLRDLLRIRGKFSPKEATQLMIDITSGLAYAAERGLTHRDLKTSNVLISARGRAKLVDFGLAAFAEQVSEDGQASNPRTVDYAGLEIATNAPRDDSRSDIFFAGSIFYHMLSGVLPLNETRDRSERLSAGRYLNVKPIAQIAPDLPRSVASVVNKAMETNPDRRYQTPGQMLMDLKMAAKRLEMGDESAAGEIRGKIEAQNEARIAKQFEGYNKTIMIVESNMDMQNVLRDRLKKYGYRVLVISNPQRALDRYAEDASPADIIVFSAIDMGEPALEAFNRFATDADTKDKPAVLIIKERQKAIREAAELGENRAIMTMPVKVRDLRRLVHELLKDPLSEEDEDAEAEAETA
ncbi:protein kinase domain-containing protein [Blastopirellula marina]|uniref:Serine/threonine protein kinase n=1 Tax=Blastopirellula marina TaxID=124 RepID=A0A2S8FNV6_9BACT|nr:protein kinase [Blastopirellula marina]PQO33882.1 serine/threonine protein kinase [Blastopirellula marina]PTL43669.1 serine/threonine protein kinase [Blastopirellula marina]